MNKSPAFQFYPDKWQTHTAHLSDSAYRLYHEMLCWMWQHSKDQCSIPSNPETISILMRRVSDGIPSALQEIMNPAMPLLKIIGENYISDGLRKEVKKQTERRRSCSDSAKTRWDNELRKKNEQCERNANAMPTVCSPSPSPSPSPDIDREREKTGFSLDDCLKAAEPIGMKRDDVEAFFHRYNRQGWVFDNGKTIISLHSALATWKSNQSSYGKKTTIQGKTIDIKPPCSKCGYWHTGTCDEAAI